MTTPTPENTIELGSPQFWTMLKTDSAFLAAEVVKIDLVALEMTLQRHAGLRAWVSAQFEAAKVAEAGAKNEVERARARATLDARKVDDARTNKPKTVEVLKAEVELHSGVITREDGYLEAQAKTGALRAMNQALEDRKDMLIQISSNQRKESGAYNRA